MQLESRRPRRADAREQSCSLPVKTIRLTTVLAAAAILAGCAAPDADAPAEDAGAGPPNIVLILADDLGYADIGIYGSEIISTPHIDALAASGVLFTAGYVSHPVCSPSRAGLITGRHQQRHGWEFNPAGRDVGAGMSLEESTLADRLKALGYRTGMIGKWHLGHPEPHHPMSRGFDEYFGVLEGGSIFIDSRLPGVEYGSRRGEEGPTERRNKVLRGFEEEKVERYLTDVFTDEATGFIERSAGGEEPFFLYLSHTTPHTPLQATAEYVDGYRHIEDQRTRVYAAMVASLDESVRRVVETLKAQGVYENTLIAFASDNGCAGYIGNACSNGPLFGFKRYHHEGGVRIPFIMSWPEMIQGGQTLTDPVITLDYMATFTAAAGDETETEDSVNLLPYMTGGADGAPHEYLYWRAGPSLAIRDARYKLIKLNRTDFRPENLRRDGRLQPPEGGWATDSPHGQVTFLYDLEADVGELNNLAEGQPEIVARLEAELDGWRATLATEQILPGVRSTITEIDGEWVQLVF